MNTNIYESPRGFSLIELMVTCAIIGVLGFIALPSFVNQIEKGRRSDGRNAVLECASKLKQRFTSSNAFPEEGVCDEQSESGFYAITVTIGGDPVGTTFEVSALAVGAQASDLDCQQIILTNTGFKGAEPEENAEECWD